MALRRRAEPETCVGMKIGSSCSVAVWNPDEMCTETICDEYGSRFMPAVVAYTDGGVLVGQEAMDQMHTNPANTIFDFKRLLGLQHEVAAEQVKARWPFKVVKTGDVSRIEVTRNGEKELLAPAEILAELLRKMKQIAEAHSGAAIKRVVLNVSAAFIGDQPEVHRSLEGAARLAGLDVRRIVNDSAAISWAYGVGKTSVRVVVFSMGRSGFIVSALLLAYGTFQVFATAGDGHLGGAAMDERLARHAAAEFKRKHGIDLAGQPGAMHGLLRDCERAKIALSTTSETALVVQHGDLALSLPITRSKFEELIADVITATRDSLDVLLKKTYLKADQVEYVLFAGGSSAVPCLQRVLRDRFTLAAVPAPLQPLREVVAHGLAMPKHAQRPLPSDLGSSYVLPISIGVGLADGTVRCVLPRNTAIPCKRTLRFATARDNQTAFDVGVHARSVGHHVLMHTITVEGIVPGPAGANLLDVTFDVDAASAVLSVTAEYVNHRSARGTVRRAFTVARSAQEAGPIGMLVNAETAAVARASLQRGVDSVARALTLLQRTASEWEPSYAVSRERRSFAARSSAALDALRVSVSTAQEWLAEHVQSETSAEAYAATQRAFEAATASAMGPPSGSFVPPCIG